MAIFNKFLNNCRAIEKFQWAVVTIACFGQMMDTFAIIEIVFLTPRLKHWCKEFENETDFLNGTEELKDVCWARTQGMNCTPEFDDSFTSYSVTEQYDMICDRDYLVTLSSTTYFAGWLIGVVFSGFLSDRFGRRIVITVANVLNVICLTAAAFAPNFPMFAVFRMASGACLMAWFTAMWVIVVEVSNTATRLTLTILPLALFGVAQMFMAAIAFFVRHHRYLQLVAALGMIPVVIAAYFFVPESPRWLLSQGKDDDAYAVCERIAKYNGHTIAETTKFFANNDEEESKKSRLTFKTFSSMFGTFAMSRITIVIMYLWSINSMVYYGLTMGSADFGTNVFVNVFLSGLVETLAAILLFFILDKTGRRSFHTAMFILAGVCLGGMVPFFTDKESVWLTLLAMAGKFGISASFNGIYIWTSEIYPTMLRNGAMGLGSGSARIGSLLAPNIGRLSQFWPPGGIMVFSVLALLAGLLCLLIPETFGKSLPQSIDDTKKIIREDKLQLPCCCTKRKKNIALHLEETETALKA